MGRILLLILLLLHFNANAQLWKVDIFGGFSNYQGDLQPRFFTLQNANAGAGIHLKYGLNENIYIRAGVLIGSVAGDDKYNKLDLVKRNLNFRSSIKEFTIGGEYLFLNESKIISPYIFAGIGAFIFNPYTYDPAQNYQRVYLHNLSTEGQGLSEYPDRKPYSLLQFCIPYGAGFKVNLNCNLQIGLDFRQTKIFTDYLDDVSKTYVDRDALFKARGQQAVDLAWRRDEFDGTPYPSTEAGRGNPAQKDWYYFAGMTLGLTLNDCETGDFTLGGLFKNSNGKGLINIGRAGAGGSRGYGTRKNWKKQQSCPVL